MLNVLLYARILLNQFCLQEKNNTFNSKRPEMQARMTPFLNIGERIQDLHPVEP
jgi:hypothetical protein